jgi:predicted nuclease of predicted toxin-antitoxin system
MKVLIDDGIHPDIVAEIDDDHDTQRIRAQLGRNVLDPEVMDYARYTDRVVVTDDKVFTRITLGDLDPPDVTQRQNDDVVVSHGRGRRAVLHTIDEINGTCKVIGIGADSHNGVIIFSQQILHDDQGLDAEDAGEWISATLQRIPDQHIHQHTLFL